MIPNCHVFMNNKGDLFLLAPLYLKREGVIPEARFSIGQDPVEIKTTLETHEAFIVWNSYPEDRFEFATRELIESFLASDLLTDLGPL